MTTQETANKLVLLAVLKKIVGRLDRDLRATVDMDPGDRKTARAADRKIGHVLLTDPKPAFRVTDRAAFHRWVQDNRPDEVVPIVTVRSSFESAILERGCDEQGEAIPGIEWVEPAPDLRVTPDPDAEEAIRAELAREGLSFAGVLDSLSVNEIEP